MLLTHVHITSLLFKQQNNLLPTLKSPFCTSFSQSYLALAFNTRTLPPNTIWIHSRQHFKIRPYFSESGMLVSFQYMLHTNDLIYKTCYQQASKNSSSQKVPILFSEKFSMKCIFDAQQLRGLKNNCSKRIKAAIRRPSYLHVYCILGQTKIVRDT